MRWPVQAIVWEMWGRNRLAALLVCGLTALGYILNAVLPEAVSGQLRNNQAGNGAFAIQLLNMHLAAGVIMLTLALCSYTEANPQTGTRGFPHRLFVLPLPTWQLVAVPMLTAIAMIESVYLLWARFLLEPGERSTGVALVLGVYIMVHQTVLWTLHRVRSLRLLVLGFIAIIFIMSPIVGFVYRVSENAVTAALAGLALGSFLMSWTYIARQRSVGTKRRGWLTSRIRHDSVSTGERFVEWISDRSLRRDRPFKSAAAAQFWFEWQRCGSVFPIVVGTLLAIVVAPFSWLISENGADSLRILLAVLAMPVILALPIGKAFSKPDFWDTDLTLSGVVAVRPMSSVELVSTKLKVAALSAALSWLLVLIFVAVWIPFWANPDSIAMISGLLSEVHAHTALSPYVVAALGILALMLLTWRFLVGGLWLGLSGNKNAFALSAVPYVVVPLIVLPAILVNSTNSSLLGWIHDHSNRLMEVLVWILAAAVVAKFSLAIYACRNIPPSFVRRYLPIWLAGTVIFVALAVLLSSLMRTATILIALLLVPLARIAVAPALLARNRHR